MSSGRRGYRVTRRRINSTRGSPNAVPWPVDGVPRRGSRSTQVGTRRRSAGPRVGPEVSKPSGGSGVDATGNAGEPARAERVDHCFTCARQSRHRVAETDGCERPDRCSREWLPRPGRRPVAPFRTRRDSNSSNLLTSRFPPTVHRCPHEPKNVAARGFPLHRSPQPSTPAHSEWLPTRLAQASRRLLGQRCLALYSARTRSRVVTAVITSPEGAGIRITRYPKAGASRSRQASRYAR